MAAVINTNYLSLVAQNNLNKSQSALGSAIERLSSGLRINSAKDDAAGQAIANRFTANVNGLTQAARNANDGISIAQTTEGALNEINNNLQRVRQLSVQAANGTNSKSDLDSIQAEIKQRLDEIDRVSGQTQFNGVNVLAKDNKLTIQVGANDNETITIDLQEINADTLGLGNFSVTNAAKLSSSVAKLSDTTAGQTFTQAVALGTATASGETFEVVDGAAIGVAGGTITTTFQTPGGDDVYQANINGKSHYVGDDGTLYKMNAAGDGLEEVQVDDGTGALTSVKVGVSDKATGQLVAFIGGAAGTPVTAVDVSNVNAPKLGKAISFGDRSLQVDGKDVFAILDSDGKATDKLAVKDSDGTLYAVVVDAATGAASYATAAADATKGVTAGTRAEYVVKTDGTVIAAFRNAENELYEAPTAAATGNAPGNKIDSDTLAAGATGSPLKTLDAALSKVDALRSDLGAIQNRFESTIANLNNTVNNLSAARSRIEDADYATEVSNMTKAQILQQAGTSVLAQANQVPQTVLSLLR